MATKRYREEFKNPLDEGKLVMEWNKILKFLLETLGKKLTKSFQKNRERGIADINTIGAMINFKVTDKKQEQGKLFLKFGDNLTEEILNEEDAAVRAAKLKAQQVEEMEALKRKQVEEMDAMKERHERENEKIALDKEKEAQNKAIEAERESARKAAQNEEVNEGIDSDAMIDLMQKYLNTKNKNEKKKILKQINKYQKKLGLKVTEALGADADVGDYIKDFRKSDAPQFKGKSDKKIRQMAFAAWKDAQ